MAVRRVLFPSTPGTPAKKAKLATTAQVRRMIQKSQETKHYSENVSFSGSTALGAPTGINYNLCNIANGNAQGQRDGNKIKILSVEIRMKCKNSGSARLILYSPKDPSQALAPAISTVAGVQPDAWMHSVDSDTIWVHYDHIYPANEFSGDVAINLKKKFNHYVEYPGTGGTTFTKNPVYMLILFEFGAANSGPLMIGHYKTWYKDP